MFLNEKMQDSGEFIGFSTNEIESTRIGSKMERASSAGLRLLVDLENEVLGTSYEQWACQRETDPVPVSTVL